MRRKIVGLCEGSAFHEYFDLESAAGHDSVLFSWLVALLLYVLLTFIIDGGKMRQAGSL